MCIVYIYEVCSVLGENSIITLGCGIAGSQGTGYRYTGTEYGYMLAYGHTHDTHLPGASEDNYPIETSVSKTRGARRKNGNVGSKKDLVKNFYRRHPACPKYGCYSQSCSRRKATYIVARCLELPHSRM